MNIYIYLALLGSVGKEEQTKSLMKNEWLAFVVVVVVVCSVKLWDEYCRIEMHSCSLSLSLLGIEYR
jgi:hypothetical protein